MKNYAYAPGGVVAELFTIDGDIAEQRHPHFVALCYELINAPDVAVGWVLQGDKFEPATIPADQLAAAARLQRDSLFREFYDPQINMALREQRDGSAAAAARVTELDAYATALQAIPEQKNFPQKINWPDIP